MNPQNGYSFCISNEISHHNNDESWNPVLLSFLPTLDPSGFSLLNNRVSCLLMLLSWRHESCFSGCTGAFSAEGRKIGPYQPALCFREYGSLQGTQAEKSQSLASSLHFTRKPLIVRWYKVTLQKVAFVAGSHLLNLSGCVCRRLRCVRGCCLFYEVQMALGRRRMPRGQSA